LEEDKKNAEKKEGCRIHLQPEQATYRGDTGPKGLKFFEIEKENKTLQYFL
jgi:hypothetical protein